MTFNNVAFVYSLICLSLLILSATFLRKAASTEGPQRIAHTAFFIVTISALAGLLL